MTILATFYIRSVKEESTGQGDTQTEYDCTIYNNRNNTSAKNVFVLPGAPKFKVGQKLYVDFVEAAD